jgi:hypothetical protein
VNKKFSSCHTHERIEAKFGEKIPTVVAPIGFCSLCEVSVSCFPVNCLLPSIMRKRERARTLKSEKKKKKTESQQKVEVSKAQCAL